MCLSKSIFKLKSKSETPQSSTSTSTATYDEKHDHDKVSIKSSSSSSTMSNVSMNVDELKVPTGHDSRYCLNDSMTLKIEKKISSWSGGDYIFRDENDNVLVKTVGKANLKQETTFFDPNDNEILKLSIKMGTLSWAIIGTSPTNGEKLFEVRLDRKWRSKCNILTEFNDISTGQTQIAEYDTWKRLSSTNGKGKRLMLNNNCVAFVYKGDWLKKRRTVDIAANMDYTLVMATVIFFDLVMDQWIPAGF
ncbi:uncharacterized protein L201_003171 [Kwoniella dendrophila CBS 6074]|uniref:Tubby C-terminal-like domain-containing protein n=1 Tax=Kwoniella dendrophila CBS 6074 TaxID=1295534 RepID=A0AAX4JTL1_9TREE